MLLISDMMRLDFLNTSLPIRIMRLLVLFMLMSPFSIMDIVAPTIPPKIIPLVKPVLIRFLL